MNDIERIDKAVKAVCDKCKCGYDDPFISGTGEYFKSLVEKGITIDELPITLMMYNMKEERDFYRGLYRKATELLFDKNRTEEAIGAFFMECHATEFYLDNDSMSAKARRWIIEALTKDGQ